MIDLERIWSGVGGLLGQAGLPQTFDVGEIASRLGETGLDPSALAELAPEQIVELLSQQGIDLSQIGGEQLQQIIAQLTEHGR